MRKYVWCTFAGALCVISSFAQSLDKAASDAFILTRMIEKFHVQPRPLDDNLSSGFFKILIEKLDENKIFFTQEDILKLEAYRFQLDDEVRTKKSSFLRLLTNTYGTRLSQVDTMIDNICKTPFNFVGADKFTVKEDTSYAANTTSLRNKLHKRLKLSVLSALVDLKSDMASLPSTKEKKLTDSLEVVVRKRTATIYKRAIRKIKDGPGGLQQAIADEYCRSLALCYDPHTAYFAPSEKENFEGMLGAARFQFGFGIDESEGDGVEIGNLKPGSAAFKSGMLNVGDKIESLKWEGQKSIDVSDASAEEVSELLNESNHDKLTLSIKKADGTTREITLQKEKSSADNEDEDRVRSFLLKGSKTIGYISLPAFYTDWSGNEGDVNGCANDVAKEIVKLKKEKIDGLILDIRYNGGGSMEEAMQLSGIFIDAGPVGQVKTKEAKVFTLKDANRGTIYDGPLVLMVNGYSASASEIVAGTLQDYNRALVVGTPTYGKATAQIVLPMDTTIDLDKETPQKQTSSFIKVTVDKLYRINGTTAQGQGVMPDVLLPDMSIADERKEANELNTLPANSIDPNKFYKPYPALQVSVLKQFADAKIASSDYFKALNQNIQLYKATRQSKDLSLNMAEAIKGKENFKKLFADHQKSKNDSIPVFTIINNAFTTKRIATDKTLQEMNEELKGILADDEQLKIAFLLAGQMVK